jgi:hypothetical protein
MRFILLIISIGFLSACSTLPTSFSTDNIMKVHQGMSSDEILKMFGKPKSVSQAVCGSDTGHAWTCTTWEYGAFPYDRASFTFSGDDPKNLKLNNFKVDRD